MTLGRLLFVCAALFAGLASTPAGQDAPAATLAITGGTLIDGLGGPPLADAVILVNGSRITAVGAAGRLRLPAGVKTLDATGRFVTPGLINANVHLAMNGLADGHHWTTIASRFESYVADYARVSLLNGLTTVRDTWGPTDALIAVRDRIARGEITGSRIVTSGLIVQHPGPLRRLSRDDLSAFDPAVLERIWAQMECDVRAGTLDEARTRFRALIAKRIDFVKFSATGDDHGDGPVLSQERLDMIVREAHAAGLTAESHTMEADGLRMALQAGADAMQHPQVTTRPVDAALLRLMVHSRAIAVPLVVALHRHTLELDDPQVIASVPGPLRPDYDRFLADARRSPELQRKLVTQFRQNFDVALTNLRAMIAAGVPIAMGTDAGTNKNFHEAANHFEELEWYVQLGMTPMAALQTATRNGARLLRRDDLGVVAPGMVADLLIVNGNPLDDVRVMRRLDAVIKEGILVRR